MEIRKKQQKKVGFLADLLFPNYCIGCKKRGFYICPSCLNDISKIDKEVLKNVWSIFDYRDPVVKRAIWELKYQHKYQLAHELGVFLYNFSLEKLSLILNDKPEGSILIIPIPMSKRKQWKRGYNQAYHIARGFHQKINSNSVSLDKNILIKKKKTEPQASIKNKYYRLKNIRGAFDVRGKNKIAGKTILLIDDVVTTGGTIQEASRVLRKAGAKKIYTFTLAH